MTCSDKAGPGPVARKKTAKKSANRNATKRKGEIAMSKEGGAGYRAFPGRSSGRSPEYSSRGASGRASQPAAVEKRRHPLLSRMEAQLRAGRCDRREFLRSAVLLGLSIPAAYSLA